MVEAIVAGASGYIFKTAQPKAIIAAVRATAAGESVISSQIAGKLLQRIRERDIPVTATSHDAASAIRSALTQRELEIFDRLASGKTNREIARELSLSTNTVHNHIASILARLHLHNRIQQPSKPSAPASPNRGDRAEPRVLSATAIARLRNGK